MKINLFIKKVISFFLIFNFLFLQTAQAMVGVSDSTRTSDISTDILKSGKPSDLPVASVSKFFTKGSEELAKNFDISNYIGKKIFVGYGVFDSNQDNCKFVEQPNISRNEIDSSFAFHTKFNQHTYGITNTKVSYQECKSLATKFGGNILTVDTKYENLFIAAELIKRDINSVMVGKAWLGAFMPNSATCPIDYYTNDLNMEQRYTSWKTEEIAATCDTNNKNVTINSSGKWEKTNSLNNNYCIIEFDSPNIYRPLKKCASWWKIMRDYPIDIKLYDKEMLKSINQADIPIQMQVCTKYSPIVAKDIMEKTPRVVHCLKYNTRNEGPEECLRDSNLPQCLVNECKGYIQKNCDLLGEEKVGKGYVKGEITLNNELIEVKVKDNVRTLEYECPPSPPSVKNCLEESTVVIYPKECNTANGSGSGSQCQELKECVLENGNKPKEEDSNGLLVKATKKCYVKYPCIKIYASRDLNPTISSTGEVLEMHGKCPPNLDGTPGVTLDFTPNVSEKMGKKCIEYEEVTKEQKLRQSCFVSRSETNHILDMSITAHDDYENDPMCIRADSVHASLAKNQINFKVTKNGFFKTKITRVDFNGETKNILNTGSDKYILMSATPRSGLIPSENLTHISTPNFDIKTEDINTDNNGVAHSESGEDYDLGLNCSDFDPNYSAEGKIQNSWYLKNTNLFFNQSLNTYVQDPYLTIEKIGSNSKVTVKSSYFKTFNEKSEKESACNSYASDHGFSEYVTDTDFKYDFGSDIVTCNITLSNIGIDNQFTEIQSVSDNSLKYTFKSAMDRSTCLRKAYCMDGYFNESDFSGSGSSTCKVTTGDGSPDYMTEIRKDAGIPEPEVPEYDLSRGECVPAPTEESTIPVELKAGFQSIVIVEDYLRGGWGYFSNNTIWNPVVNKVSVKSTSLVQAASLPMNDLSTISDYIHYNGVYIHDAKLKKSPDMGMSALAGLATYGGGALWYSTMSVSLAGGAVIAAVVIITIIATARPKKMDRQRTRYHMYKDIPLEFLDKNRPYDSRKNVKQDIIANERLQKALLKKESFEEDNGYINQEAIDKNNKEIERFSDPDGFKRLTYWHTESDTGTGEPNDIKPKLDTYFAKKQLDMICGGISPSQVNTKITIPDEKQANANRGYPSCSVWNPWCEKTNTYYDQYLSNAQVLAEVIPTTKVFEEPSNFKKREIQKVAKTMTTVYLGATNTLVILVPFIGDYEIKALDKYNNVLSTSEVPESAFIRAGDPNELKQAQVNFGWGMDLAEGISEGDFTNACRKDPATEWGGGVSGVFFEAQRTNLSEHCQKSNNSYVKDFSMTKISIRPKNIDKAFIYTLTRPMPFPNRVWIATLDKKEKRHYKCFGDFGSCSDQDYKEVE